MEHQWSQYPQKHQQDDFLEFSHPHNTMNSVAVVPPTTSLYPETDTLQQLKHGFSKMMMTMERLEQRLNRLEQTTNQILKNQQETLQVPFMSQSEIDRARQVAEQMEQDSSVAKQLQAAYNKEIELRKSMSSYPIQQNQQKMADCPICGVRVNPMDLEVHVDQCLEMFSNDPKKEAEVKDTKKKIESGFFSKLFKKTETTKVVTTQTATAPIHGGNNQEMSQGYYPPFAYPPFPNQPMQPAPNMPMMMPMYMYPSYPHTHITTALQE